QRVRGKGAVRRGIDAQDRRAKKDLWARLARLARAQAGRSESRQTAGAAAQMNDRKFLDAFEACAIASTDFHHADHVRLGWNYLHEHPLLEAIERFTTSLQRFA